MINQIKSVVIVGGGSSGWMTAAAFTRRLPHIKVTLVESPNFPIIGVGESTLGHINQYMHLIDLKDEDWMKHCDASYKTSIKFTDFTKNPEKEAYAFHYPFGQFDFTDKPRGIMDWFIYKALVPETPTNNFAEFHHDSVLMANRNKMTDNSDGMIRGFNFNSDTAYHFDAIKFGQFLKNHICIPGGVNHILDEVSSIVKNDRGEISKLVCKKTTIEADLFIDCTGFKSLLLEQTMGVPFISFNDVLQNDRAVATTIPYIDKDRELENYTNCTAIECGWVWNIPLWSRIGTGYVYSSKFATEEEAEAQFRKHLKSNRMIIADKDRADAAKFRHIKIKHGVHERSWEKNVVAIGLSNGFIEPLESTGLMLTHQTIIKLIHLLLMRDNHVNKFDIDQFNYIMRDETINFKNFVAHHYAMSLRKDTPYWKSATENITYSKSMANYFADIQSPSEDLAHQIYRSHAFTPDLNGIVYIAAAMGYNPVYENKVKALNLIYHEDPTLHTNVRKDWEKHRDEVLKYIDTLPTHNEYLQGRYK